MNFRVNAGIISKDHWIQKPEIGGGRIIGEMCHFFDLMEYLCDSAPVKVSAESIIAQNDKFLNQDNVIISIKFANGSVGTLTYVSNGDTSLPKERLEVFCGGIAFVIQDFRNLMIYSNGKEAKIDCLGKGHREEVDAFMEAIQNSSSDPIPFSSILQTTLVCFKAIESLNTGLPQIIEQNI
jgi:polar amino acid transport system substrate-binding protein